MRGAFGKPQGVCARVDIGQILLSIRCKDVHNTMVSLEILSSHPHCISRAVVITRNILSYTSVTQAPPADSDVWKARDYLKHAWTACRLNILNKLTVFDCLENRGLCKQQHALAKHVMHGWMFMASLLTGS